MERIMNLRMLLLERTMKGDSRKERGIKNENQGNDNDITLLYITYAYKLWW